jgi:LCP family protein required for cell wall assembly
MTVKSKILAIAVTIIAAFLLVSVYIADRKRDMLVIPGSTRRLSEVDTNLQIMYNGKDYAYKGSLVTVLFMGTDKTAAQLAENKTYRNHGQADFLMLLVIDPGERKVTRLMIDRDTLTEITTLGVLGDYSGTRVERVSLSHSFGDGGEWSCELTADAVSGMLYGVGVDLYVSISLDGIPKLNEAVGGVEVTLADDFSMYDPAMTIGATITLQGEQAELYVRGRMGVGVCTNEACMTRQREFLGRLADKIGQRSSEGIGILGAMLDDVSDDIVSNMTRARMINEMNRALLYDTPPMEALPGRHYIDKQGFMAFELDENAVREWVVNVFYRLK